MRNTRESGQILRSKKSPRLTIRNGRESRTSSKRIDEQRLQTRVLLDLGDEVDRRLLPPVHLARREVVRRVPGIGNVSPDHLVEVHLLAAGRSARYVIARHVV